MDASYYQLNCLQNYSFKVGLKLGFKLSLKPNLICALVSNCILMSSFDLGLHQLSLKHSLSINLVKSEK